MPTSLVTRTADIVVDADDHLSDVSIEISPAKDKTMLLSSEDEALTARKGSKSGESPGSAKRTGASSQLVQQTASSKTKRRDKAGGPDEKRGKHHAMLPHDEARLTRALTSNAGVAVGARLYNTAKKKKATQEESKEGAVIADKREEKELRECTFRPTLSNGTLLVFAEAGSYRRPDERFDAQALRLAKQRIMQQHLNEHIETNDCTFKPSIEPVSAALVERSRKDRPYTATPERLHRDGLERQLRHTLRAEHMRSHEEAERVGAKRRLSPSRALSVANRLQQWGSQRERNLELMRREEETTLRPRRSRSCDDKEFFERLHCPAKVSDDVDCPPPGTSSVHREEHGGAPVLLSERSKEMAEELRQIRFRALFAKYLHGNATTTTLRSVMDSVQTLFPQEKNIVEALRQFSLNETITRDAFVACLSAFEKKFGPQPWGRMEHHRLHEDDDDAADDKELRSKRRRRIPQISEASEKLTAHRNQNNKPIHEYLLEQGEAHRRRVEARQQEALAAELPPCTFRPLVNPLAEGARRNSSTIPKSHKSTPASSLNASCDYSFPPTPTAEDSIKRCSFKGAEKTISNKVNPSSPSGEIDELLQQIQQHIASDEDPSSSVYVMRCAAPLSPHAVTRATPKSCAASPLCVGSPRDRVQSPLTALHNVTNHSGSVAVGAHRCSSPSGGAVQQSLHHDPHSVPCFSGDVDTMLDSIYCKVETTKSYAKAFAERKNRERSPKAKRSISPPSFGLRTIRKSQPFR